jgi:hypothetical protein
MPLGENIQKGRRKDDNLKEKGRKRKKERKL